MPFPSQKMTDSKWSLVPFAVTAVGHFVLSDSEPPPTLYYCALKCAPILSLMLFVLLRGRVTDADGAGILSRRILIGLALSAVGDALLVFDYFKLGTVAFAATHVFYSSAFGFHPLRPLVGALCALGAFAIFVVLRPGLSGSLQILVPAYMLLIATMVWRASARVRSVDCQLKTGRLWGCVGAIFFWISDGVIAVNKFVHPIPYSHTLDMATYYVGQLGIALTTLDSESSKATGRRK